MILVKWFAQKHLHGFIPQMYVQASLMLVLTGEHLLLLQLTVDMYSFPVRVENTICIIL